MEYSHFGIGGLQTTSNALKQANWQLFQTPNYTTDYVDRKLTTFHFQNIDDKNGPYRCQIFGNSSQYLDMKNAFLTMKIRLSKMDGGIVYPADDVSVIPIPLSTMWRKVGVSINNREIPEMDQEYYAYKGYLETVMSYSGNSTELDTRLAEFDGGDTYNRQGDAWKEFNSKEAAKNKEKKTVDGVEKMVLKDLKDMVTVVPEDTRKETPLWRRWAFFTDNSSVRESGGMLVSSLHLDVFQQEKLIPPGTNIGLTFVRNKHDFYILDNKEKAENNTKYYLEIRQMDITVPFITLSPTIFNTHLKSFQSGKMASYLYEKLVPKTKQFPASMTELQFYQLSQGILPKAVYAVMVNTEDFDGNVNRSPFIFQHNNVTKASLQVDNREFPGEPLKCDFSGYAYETFHHFLKNIGIKGSDDMFINETIYKNDYTIFAWDLSPDNCNGFHLHPAVNGTLNLTFTLKEALPKSTTLLVFLSYNQLFSMNNVTDSLTFQSV